MKSMLQMIGWDLEMEGFNRGRVIHCIHCSIMSNKSFGSSGCKILRIVEDVVVVDTASKGGK